MTSRRWWYAVLAGASFSLLSAVAVASPQVVGDDACAKHEVDIASFATCVDGKVVRPETDERASRNVVAYAAFFAPDARLANGILLALAPDAARTPATAGCPAAPAVAVAAAQPR
ncbi:MAG: hypothetical protein U1F15_11160 [Burkholderiales bacterium]